jgi:hypothetical protein
MVVENRPQGNYQLRPLAAIKSSPMNELIYGPIDLNRPDMQRLIESIRRNGLKDPIVITRDNVIISGHRRHAACKFLGRDRIMCRVEPIQSTDPGFSILLVEYNSQRVKTFEETAREHVATMKPGEAYQALIEHRREQSAVGGDKLDLGERKRRSKIGPAKMPLLDAAMSILEVQKSWWPLSVRSVHYSILNAPPLRNAFDPESTYTNDLHSYRDLVNVLVRARLEGLVPWKAIADPASRDVERVAEYRRLRQEAARPLHDGLLPRPDDVAVEPHRDRRREEHDRGLDQTHGDEVLHPLHHRPGVLLARAQVQDVRALEGQRQGQAHHPDPVGL